jgi:uncharacterized DUF497 family protein
MGLCQGRDESEKHGLSFDEASTVFQDPLAITYPDVHHAAVERREITIGHTERGRLIFFLAHSQRGRRIRLISARPATRAERKQYEEIA